MHAYSNNVPNEQTKSEIPMIRLEMLAVIDFLVAVNTQESGKGDNKR